MKMFRLKWIYQEWYFRWTVWGLGWFYVDKRGWEYDELTLFFGPLRIDFISVETLEDGVQD